MKYTFLLASMIKTDHFCQSKQQPRIPVLPVTFPGQLFHGGDSDKIIQAGW